MLKFLLKQIISFVFLIKLCDAANYLKVPPDFITPCNFSNPQFKDCLKAQTQQLFVQLSKGVPGLKSVRPTDPYHITRIKFSNDGNENVKLKTTLTNVVIEGLKDIKVEYCNVDSKDYTWDAKFLVPKLKFETDYEVDGRILIITLKGNGKLFMEVDNMRLVLHANTVLYERGGFQFYNITKFFGDVVSIDGVKIDIRNLFGGNKELEQSTNEFFNENWRDVYEVMKPLAKQTIEEIIFDIIRKIYSYIPANFFIPDIVMSK